MLGMWDTLVTKKSVKNVSLGALNVFKDQINIQHRVLKEGKFRRPLLQVSFSKQLCCSF